MARQKIFIYLFILLLFVLTGAFLTWQSKAQLPPPTIILDNVTSACAGTVANNTLSWTANDFSGSPSFAVFRKEGGGSFAQIGSVLSLPYIYTDATGVQSDKIYTYQIREISESVESNTLNSSPAYCPTTVLITGSCQADGPRASLSWQAVSGSVLRYDIVRDAVVVDSTNNAILSYIDGPVLSGGQNYNYQVRAVWQDNHTEDSDVALFTTPSCPVILQNPNSACLNDTAPGGPQINLTWNALSGAQSYKILRKTSLPGNVYSELASTNSLVFTDNLVDTLSNSYSQPGISIYYQIQTVFSSGSQSSPCLEKTIVVPQCKPFLATQPFCSGEINLSWTKTIGASNYNVYRDGGSGLFCQCPGQLSCGCTSENTFTDYLGEVDCPAGICDCTHTYQIKTVVNGSSLDSNIGTATLSCASPPLPSPAPILQTPILFCDSGVSKIRLFWSGSNNLSYYSINRNAFPILQITNTTHDDQVESGYNYLYSVDAYGPGGGSTPSSNNVTATSLACVSPSQPILTLATDCEIGSPYIDVDWTPSSNTLKYEIWSGVNPLSLTLSRTFTKDIDIEYNTTLWKDSFGLVYNTTYYYQVKAIGPEGVSPTLSTVQSITTGNCYPAMPTAVNVSQTACLAGQSNVNISWQSTNKNTVKYQVLKNGVSIAEISAILLQTNYGYQDANVIGGASYNYQVRAVGFFPNAPQNQVQTTANLPITVNFCQLPGAFTVAEPSFVCHGQNNSYPKTDIAWSPSNFVQTYDLTKKKVDPSNGLVLEVANYTNVISPVTEKSLGKALQFDGANDYAIVQDNAIWNTGGQITVEAWVKLTGACSGDAIAVHDLSQFKWMLYCTSNALYFYVRATNGNTYFAGPSANLNDGKWHHLAGTFDRTLGANRVKLYVDGALSNQAAGINLDVLAGDEGIYVGSYYLANPNGGLVGLIDELRVYKRAITAAEATQHYQGVFSNETDLIGLWHFDEGFGQEATNSVNSSLSAFLGSAPFVVDVSDPLWKDNGLQPEYKYNWQATAKNFGGQTLSNQTVSASPIVCSPTKPGLVLSGTCFLGKLAVNLQWSFAWNANKILIYRAGVLIQTINSGTLEFLSRTWRDDNNGLGLLNNTAYSYNVVAESAGGQTSSDVRNVSTGVCAPQAFAVSGAFGCTTCAGVAENSCPKVDLTWSPVSGASYYMVFRNSVALCSSILNCPTASPYIQVYPNVNVNTAYTYQVKAYDSANVLLATSDLVNIAASQYCNPATPIIQGLSTNCNVDQPYNIISWKDPTPYNTSQYVILRGGGQGTPVATINSPAANNQWQDNNVAISTNYIYRVRSVGLNSQQVTSANSNITTFSCSVTPSAIANFNLGAVSCANNINNISLTWNNSANAYGYNVYRTNPAGSVPAISVYKTAKTGFMDKGDWALKFDGINDYVKTTNAFIFNNTGVLSLEFWAKGQINNNQNQTLIADGGSSATLGYLYLYRAAVSNNLVFQYSNGTIATNSSFVGYFTGFDNTWMHIVMVADYNQRNLKVYRNGALFIDRNIGETMLFPSQNLAKYVGSYSAASSFWKGQIDEVRVYERPLSGAEVQEHYQNIFKSEAGLRFAWHFNEASGAIVGDSSVNNNAGTIVNSPLWQMPIDKPNYIPQALSSQTYKYEVRAAGAYTETSPVPANEKTVNTGACLLTPILEPDPAKINICGQANNTLTKLVWLVKEGLDNYKLYKDSALYFTSEGNAFDFDGSDDYVKITNASNALKLIGSDATFSAWVKPRTIVGYDGVIGNNFANGWWFSLNAGKVALWSASETTVYNSSAVIPANTWTHILATYVNASRTVKFYINGVYNSVSVTAFPIGDGGASFYIGDDGRDGAGYPFDGLMDDIRVYNRVLSAGEIGQCFAGSCPPTNLTGHWDFNESGNIAEDISGNNNDGVLTNGTRRVFAGSVGNYRGEIVFIDPAQIGAPKSFYTKAQIGLEQSLNSATIISAPVDCLPTKAVLTVAPDCDNLSSRILIDWSNPPGASPANSQTLYWRLYRYREIEGPGSAISIPVDLIDPLNPLIFQTLDNNITSGEKYVYYLEGVGSSLSSFSDAVSLEAPLCFLPPSNFTASCVSKCFGYDSRMEITWDSDPLGNTLSYNIWRKQGALGSFVKIVENRPANLVLKYLNSVLFDNSNPDNNLYSYKVEAVGSGSTVFSLPIAGTVVATTLDCANMPPNPSLLSSLGAYASVSARMLSLQWVDGGNVDQYEIFRQENGGVFSRLVALDKSEAGCDETDPGYDGNCSYTDFSVEENKTYTYFVRASNAISTLDISGYCVSGCTESNSTSQFVPIAGPGNTTITVKWEAPKMKITWKIPAFTVIGGLPSFEIQRSNNAGFAGMINVCQAGGNPGDPGYITCDGNVALANCFCYDDNPTFTGKYYRARAYNAGGDSFSSAIINQMPSPKMREARR